MTTDKIIQYKKINQNTGAVINAGSCGTKRTTNIFSIGFSDFGKCGCCEDVKPIIDLNGNGAGSNTSYIFTAGDEASYVLPSVILTDLNHTTLSSIIITGSTYGVDGGNEQIEFGPNAFPSNVNNSSTYVVGGTTFSIIYTALTKTFSITNNAGLTFPIEDGESLLRLLVYWNQSITPTLGNRIFTIVINNGVQNSTPSVLTITVNNVVVDTGLNTISLLSWNRPYVNMLPSSAPDTTAEQRLLLHTYANEGI